MADGKSHTLEEGESVESVAAQHGVPVDKAWKASENAALVESRKDPHLMAPGDLVFVPFTRKEVSVPTTATHRIVVKKLSSRLKIVLRKAGHARTNVNYRLVFDKNEAKGVTGGDGLIDVVIPALTKTARLELKKSKDQTTVIPLGLRTLGPITERFGWCARLRNLGYDAETDERAEAYLALFQANNDLEPTGEMNSETEEKLTKAHGC